MPEKLLAIVVCALALIFHTLAQQGNCNLDELFTYNKLNTLISNTIVTGEGSAPTNVLVHETHTVCLSVGPSIGNVSSISLLVKYSCTGNAECPSGNSAEQFDFGCNSSNEWSSGQFSYYQAARHKNPIANFATALRKDCASCFTQHQERYRDSFLRFDQVTHCVSKFMIHII